MTTTIAVRASTAQLLTRLKENIGAKSIDEAIVTILHKAEKMPSSKFGSQPRLKPFREEEKAHSHEL